MENTSNPTDKKSASVLPSEEHATAHDLAQRMIDDENFHVSEEQIKNIDTSGEVSSANQKEADKLADNLEKDGAVNSTELIGE